MIHDYTLRFKRESSIEMTMDNNLKVFELMIKDMKERIQLIKTQKTVVNKKFEETKAEFNENIDVLLKEMTQELLKIQTKEK